MHANTLENAYNPFADRGVVRRSDKFSLGQSRLGKNQDDVGRLNLKLQTQRIAVQSSGLTLAGQMSGLPRIPQAAAEPTLNLEQSGGSKPSSQGMWRIYKPVDDPGNKDSWLEGALGELGEIDIVVTEEGLLPCSDISKRNAQQVLEDLAKGPYPAPAVYPAPEGGVAIVFQKRRGQASVLVICYNDGGAACFSTIRGKSRRSRYDDARELPDLFVRGELIKLTVSS